jgi:hypothetical protein
MGTEIRYAEPVETAVWEPNPDKPGYVRKVRQRTVGEIADDFGAKLESCGISGFEYLSTAGIGCRDVPWPEGITFVSLEVGGNEGYSIYVGVRSTGASPEYRHTLTMPIRVKVLAGRDDALAMYAVAFHLMGA